MVHAGNPYRAARRRLGCLAALLGFWASHAFASPALVIEMPSGAILYEDHATQPWYPASLTKLMTTYVALSAVRDHRIALDTPLSVSARAAMMPPSKMGFRPGSLVTLDNALKMLMVKSANDIAVVIAEGVSGSVEGFAEDMNDTARALGLTQSHFVNPNGLPNPEHVSSARDLAILARALYVTFPDQANLFNIGAMRLGSQIIANHNNLLGRYPGADGMKTGFTCAAGWNLVASASQGGRKLIAVILGAPNLRSRTIMAAALFDRGFAGIDRPSGSLSSLATPAQAAAPDMGQSICRKRGKAVAQFNTDLNWLMAPLLATHAKIPAARKHFVPTPTEALARPLPMAPRITMVPRPAFDPVPVYAGAPEGYAGLIAQARPAHSPVGTAQPPGTVSAYAEATPGTGLEVTPLPPDAGALPMKGEAKQAKSAATPVPPHRLARTEIGDTDPPVARKTTKKASHKASKSAQGKAHGRKASFAKASVPKHSKIAAKLANKAHPTAHFPAKATAHVNKTKSKTPEKHARR
jgi:D-alanyl-D-alanine carboxypeptidase